MSDGRAERPASLGLAPPRRPAPRSTPGRQQLVEAIRAEIEDGGPITFARFMQRALYEPGLGYYATRHDRPTRSGDFLTAPELHPLFGRAVAHQVHEVWQLLGRPEPFVVREYGAGSGALAEAMLGRLADADPDCLAALRYQPIEVAGRERPVVERLTAAGFGHQVRPPTAAEEPFTGCVVANEYLDALPVHRVVRRGAELREIYVAWDGEAGFVEREGPLSSPAVSDWMSGANLDLAEDQRAEVRLAADEWVGEVAAALERGAVLIFDYGSEPTEPYSADRMTGSLRAFREHHVSSDLLGSVGEQDLTAHVDLAAVRRAAKAFGLDVVGTTTQAEFLLGCGLEELVAAEHATLPDEWQPRLLLRAAVGRLLDPRQLGGYAVMVLARGLAHDAALRGLGYRVRRGAAQG